MTPAVRSSGALSASDREKLSQLIERELPDFAPRLGSASLEEVAQPFFRKHRILEVVSVQPLPDRKIHVARSVADGTLRVLTMHMGNLHALAAADPPEGLHEAARAQSYGVNASGWTTDYPLRDYKLKSLADIPFAPDGSAVAQELVAEVRQHFAERIQPQQLFESGGAFVLHYFLLNDRRLIERTIQIPRSGALVRTDTIHYADLPVPAGRMWGMVNGRLAPIG